jgi:hypothetical protein
MMSSEDDFLAALTEGHELFEVWEMLGEPLGGYSHGGSYSVDSLDLNGGDPGPLLNSQEAWDFDKSRVLRDFSQAHWPGFAEPPMSSCRAASAHVWEASVAKITVDVDAEISKGDIVDCFHKIGSIGWTSQIPQIIQSPFLQSTMSPSPSPLLRASGLHAGSGAD